MAAKYNEKAKVWTIGDFQNGIASSPHAGIADMKCLNINSFAGEAAVNYNRVNTLPVVSGGTMNSSGADNSLDYSGSPALIVGSCVKVTSSTITNFTSSTGGGYNNNYFWVVNIPSPGVYQFSKSYNGATIANFGLTGSATFSTVPIGQFVQGTYEFVQAGAFYRYYLVDNTAQVWVNDPNVYGVFSPAGATCVSSTTNCQGMMVSQGVINVFVENNCYQRFTNRIGDDTLGSVPWSTYGIYLNTPTGSTASHRAIRSQVANGAVLYPDSQFIGSIQGANSQFSLIKASGGGSTLSTVTLEQGVQLVVPTKGSELSVSVYAVQGGSVPSGLTEGGQYYVVSATPSNGQFQLASTSGGSPISVGSGNFYVTTFSPALSTTFVFTRQALALPYDEQATALAEISLGNTVNLVIGGITQSFYVWDESSTGYTTVRLPEGASGTSAILNVNNTAYIFAGNKGDIYLTNGSGIAASLTVPDYCANPNGGNQDPYFVWGNQPALIRGRVFFSIQDQNAGNTTGNCGGVWSFTPPQNGSLETNLAGSGLHLENQNSYANYNGMANVILPSQNQQAKGPQYWTGWANSYTNPTCGIDFSGTTPYTGGQAYLDSDLIPIGSFLDRGTPINFEYKLSRPLVSGETVQILARPDLTSSFALVGSGQQGGAGITTTVGALSDVFQSNIQNLQWLQARAILTSTATSPSFVPLTGLTVQVGT